MAGSLSGMSLGAHYSSLLVSQMTESDFQTEGNSSIRYSRNNMKEAEVELDGPLSEEVRRGLTSELELPSRRS